MGLWVNHYALNKKLVVKSWKPKQLNADSARKFSSTRIVTLTIGSDVKFKLKGVQKFM